MKGNPGGPGNPFAAQVQELRCAVFAEVGADNMRKIIKAHVELAIAGNVESARMIVDRCLGRPKETVEVKVGLFSILAEVKTMAEAARMTEIEAPAMPVLPAPNETKTCKSKRNT